MKAENEPEGYQWNGDEYFLIEDDCDLGIFRDCRECDLFRTKGCYDAPCSEGIFKIKPQ